jgi:tripartite motif-containing protein 71
MVVSFLRNDEELGMTKENRSVVRRALGMGASALLVCSIATASAGAAGASTPTPDPIFQPLFTRPTPFVSGHAAIYGCGAATMPDVPAAGANAGKVLIGDYWNYRVQLFNTDGTVANANFIHNPGFKPGQHQSPYGLAVDPVTANIYMADTDRYKVDEYAPDGTFIQEWGTHGSGVDQFLYPSRVAVRSDGQVYVADTWSNQVVVDDVDSVNKTVTELGTFGSFGTGDGCKWKQPHGMAWWYGPDGTSSIIDDKLFVVDTNNKQIDVYGYDPLHGGCTGTDPRGWLFSFGSAGSLPSQFKGDLRGIAIDPTLHPDPSHPDAVALYIVDAQGNKVREWASDGTKNGTTWIQNLGTPALDPANPQDGEFTDGGREVTVDPVNHTVWVGDMPDFRVQAFDGVTGQFAFAYPSPYTPPPTGGFNGPRGVAVDSQGNYFVTDTYNQRVLKYAPDGTFLTQWGTRGRDEFAFNYPRMIAIDPTDDSVVVADTDNHRIKKYDNDGNFVCQAGGLGEVGQLMRNPHGVDIGPDGKIYVTDTRNGLLKVFSPSCVFLFKSPYAKGSAGGSLTYPRGIAVDPVDGSLWVADSSLGIVKHYDVDLVNQTISYIPGDNLGSKGTNPNQWGGPFDVEVSTDRVYVADSPRNQIKVWTKTGTFVEAYGGGGKALGKFQQPQGMDFDPTTGNLWVCEQKNERVQVLKIVG